MKILISGGTGFIGEAIVRAILKKGHTVRILSRSLDQAKALFAGKPIEVVQGDITEPATLGKAVEGADVVIQCAQFPGHPVENPRKGHTYWRVDALGTENLAKAAKQFHVKHFVYLSGAGADGKRSEPWFRAKWYAEQAVRGSGIVATILRPSFVYGPRDKSLNRIIQTVAKYPILPLIGGGKSHVQPIFVDDLANIVAACVSYDGGDDRIFDVGGPQELTMKTMMKILLKILKKKRFLLPLPKLLVKLAAFPLQFLPTPPLTSNAVDFITMDVHLNITPLRKTFPGLSLKTFEEGLGSYL